MRRTLGGVLVSKLVICDRCGRAITGEPYVHRIDHKPMQHRAPTVEEQSICRRHDLCRTCAEKVSAFAGDERWGGDAS